MSANKPPLWDTILDEGEPNAGQPYPVLATHPPVVREAQSYNNLYHRIVARLRLATRQNTWKDHKIQLDEATDIIENGRLLIETLGKNEGAYKLASARILEEVEALNPALAHLLPLEFQRGYRIRRYQNNEGPWEAPDEGRPAGASPEQDLLEALRDKCPGINFDYIAVDEKEGEKGNGTIYVNAATGNHMPLESIALPLGFTADEAKNHIKREPSLIEIPSADVPTAGNFIFSEETLRANLHLPYPEAAKSSPGWAAKHRPIPRSATLGKDLYDRVTERLLAGKDETNQWYEKYKITPEAIDDILARGQQAVKEFRAIKFPSVFAHEDAVYYKAAESMMGYAEEKNPVVASLLGLKWESGYRVREDDKWMLKNDCLPDNISYEQQLLEVLRNRFPDRNITDIALEKSRIAGNGTVFIRVTEGRRFHRYTIATELGIPAVSMDKGPELLSDASNPKSRYISFPEKELREALHVRMLER